jgi:hypothetical protein
MTVVATTKGPERQTSIFHKERAETLAHSTALRHLADQLDTKQPHEVSMSIAHALRFLDDEFRSYAIAEEEVLHPEISRMAHMTTGQSALVRSNREIIELRERLRLIHRRLNSRQGTTTTLYPEDKIELRDILYFLDALMRLHTTVQNEVFLPYLQAVLEEGQLDKLGRRMETVMASYSTRPIRNHTVTN